MLHHCLLSALFLSTVTIQPVDFSGLWKCGHLKAAANSVVVVLVVLDLEFVGDFLVSSNGPSLILRK